MPKIPQVATAVNKTIGNFQQHRHTGTDGRRISFKDLTNIPILPQQSTVTLSSTQILALHSTPVTLIPAQGANIFIIVLGVMAHLTYAGTAYSSANGLSFTYTNGSGTAVTAGMGSTFLTSSASAYDYAPAVSTEFTPVANAPVVVSVPSANPTTGNSAINLLVNYEIISFT